MWFVLLGVALGALPLVMRGEYALGLAVLVGINTIIVLGLNLLMGYAGQVSLGQAAFVGIGAYATAILSAKLGWSPWLGLAAAALLGAAVAGVVGLPLLRLRGHYLAMGTLGFGIIVHIVIVQWESLTAGTVGITQIPPLAMGYVTFGEPIRMYVLVAAAVLVCVVTASNIVDSRVGRAMRAVHGSEVAASTSGVDVQRYKRQVFVLSGALAGLAGGLFAHYQGYISPESFDLSYSISLVVMAVIGGMASIWGAIFGAAAVTLINESLRALLDYREVGFGLLVVLIMIFWPEGVWRGAAGTAERAWSRGGMRPLLGAVSATLGGLAGFLLRPTDASGAQATFLDVITRGATLGELNRELAPLAQRSFAYLLIGVIVGAALGVTVGYFIDQRRRRDVVGMAVGRSV